MSPSAPRNGVATRVPPLSERALPTDETFTSIVWPGWAKAGSCAVTITAATFLGCSCAAAPPRHFLDAQGLGRPDGAGGQQGQQRPQPVCAAGGKKQGFRQGFHGNH